MIDVTLIVPTLGRDGNAYGAEHRASFEAFVLFRFPSLVRLPGNLAMRRMDRGVSYTDNSIAYSIGVPGLMHMPKLTEVLRFASGHFGGQSIIVRYLGMTESIAAA